MGPQHFFILQSLYKKKQPLGEDSGEYFDSVLHFSKWKGLVDIYHFRLRLKCADGEGTCVGCENEWFFKSDVKDCNCD